MNDNQKFYLASAVLVVIELVIIWFHLSAPVSAATGGGYISTLPYPIGIPDIDTIRDDISPELVARVRDGYITTLIGYNNDVSSNYIVFLGNIDRSNNHTVYQFVCFNYMEISTDDFPQYLYYYNMGQHYVEYYYDTATGQLSDPNFYGGWVNQWSIPTVTMFNDGVGWVLDTAEEEIYSRDDTLVWHYGASPLPISVTPLPDVPDLDNPTPENPDVPTLPPVPQWDNNLTVGENLNNTLHWLGDLMKALISNLVSNLKKFIDNLASDLKGWFQKIKDTIENGFKNLVDNLTSLFKPFFDSVVSFLTNIKDFLESLKNKVVEFVDWFMEPLDLPTAWQHFLAVPLIAGVVTPTVDFTDAFIYAWEHLSAPQRLVFSVDFSNGPFPFNTCGRVEFNFDWYENIRSIITPWILTFMIVGVVIYILQQIPGILAGSKADNITQNFARIEEARTAEFNNAVHSAKARQTELHSINAKFHYKASRWM